MEVHIGVNNLSFNGWTDALIADYWGGAFYGVRSNENMFCTRKVWVNNLYSLELVLHKFQLYSVWRLHADVKAVHRRHIPLFSCVVRVELDGAGVAVVCRSSVSTAECPAVVRRSSTAAAERRTVEQWKKKQTILNEKGFISLPFGWNTFPCQRSFTKCLTKNMPAVWYNTLYSARIKDL